MTLVSRLPRASLPEIRNRWWLALLLIACYAVTVASAFSPKMTVSIIVGVVILALVFAYPPAALYFLIIFLVAEGSPAYQDHKYLGAGISLSDAAGLLAFLTYGFGVLVGRWEDPIKVLRRHGAPGVLAVAAFFTYSIFSAAWSPAPTSNLILFMRDAVQTMITFALMIVIVMQKPGELRRFAGVYAVVGLALALYTIRTFHSHGGASTGYGFSTADWAAYRGGLPSSFQVNSLALTIALTPGMAYLASEGFSRLLQVCVMIATVSAVALSLIILDSREVLLAAVISLVAPALLSRNFKYRLGAGTLSFLVLLLVGAAVATNNLPWYVKRKLFQNTGTLDNRTVGWHIGLQLFAQRPLGGLGAQGFETYIPTFHINDPNVVNVHSDYLGSLINGGIIGLALMIAMIAVLFGTAVVWSRRHPAVVSVVAMILVSIAAADWLRSSHWIWVPVAIVYCFGLQMRTREAAPNESASASTNSPSSRSRRSGPPSLHSATRGP